MRFPRSRRWISPLLVVGAAAAGIAAFGPEPSSPAPSAVRTPLWSLRRVPEPALALVDATNDTAAGSRLQQALDADVAAYGAACFLVQRGDLVLAAHDADVPLVPASTQKLLTAAAALVVLGPDFRYETSVVTDGSADRTTVDRLFFVGSGDPVIRTAEYLDAGVSTPLESLADSIAAKGIRRVGMLEGDDSRYDTQRFLPTWSPSYRSDFDIGPLGALTVTQGIVLVNGRPVMTDDPALFAADELARLLRDRGVTVDATGRASAPHDATTVASVRSQPLRTIVTWMLATSDNLTAELLTKELGVRASGHGTTAAGVTAIQAALRNLGVSGTAGLVDGSGLDRGNQLTCRTLVTVLQLGDRADLRDLATALPLAARATTSGRVRAKGGYLTDVTGMAGFVVDDRPLRFAFLANGGVTITADADLARFVDVLTGYAPPPPVPDSLVPRP